MPVPVQYIFESVLSQLDAEGTDRYDFNKDVKPGINYAIDFCVATFNRAFGDNKITPESLRELIKVGVWQASQYSRVAYKKADTGHSLWSLLAIYPDIKTNKAVTGVTQGSPEKSFFKSDLSYLSGEKDAKRLTFQQWNNTKNNIFVQGNTVLTGTMIEYGYLDMADYGSSSYNAGAQEWEIRPSVANKMVAIVYLKVPNQIASLTDSVDFPETMANFIIERTLNYISHKQGDATNLMGVTTKDINELTALFS